MKRPGQTGFTLIEIMVTIAIVGIIAAIAIPSYRSYVMKAHRADAEAALVQVAQLMERQYTLNNSFLAGFPAGTTFPVTISATTAPLLMPTNFSTLSPYYDVIVNSAAADAFTLWAKPKTVISGSGLLLLDNIGLKLYNPTNDSVAGTAPWP